MEIYPQMLLAPGDSCAVLGVPTKLDLTKPASCIIDNEDSSAGRLYLTTLSGTIKDSDDRATEHLLQSTFSAYIATDAHRSKYLIGTKDDPFPEIKFSPAIENAPEGMRIVNFEITWKSPLPPAYILDL